MHSINRNLYLGRYNNQKEAIYIMYMDDMYDLYNEDMFMPVSAMDMPVNPMQMQQIPPMQPINPMNPMQMQQIPQMQPMNPMQQMPPMNPMRQMPPMQNPNVLFDENPYYPKLALPNALRLIKNAIGDERADQLFYEYLISEAPNQEEKNLIASIRDNEMKHNKMFKRLYFDLTGQYPQAEQEEKFEKPASYLEGLIRALKGEVGAVIKYRQILFALTFRPHINMLTEIITDEQRHASLYNYMITMNATK